MLQRAGIAFVSFAMQSMPGRVFARHVPCGSFWWGMAGGERPGIILPVYLTVNIT